MSDCHVPEEHGEGAAESHIRNSREEAPQLTTQRMHKSGAGTPRAQLRAKQIEEIKRVARAQLAQRSASGISLREITRELGLVSSAIYRYYDSRDALVTALIIDAYNNLGEYVEGADTSVPRHDYWGRWRATCQALRAWSRTHPYEYTLVYGTPLADYEAPEETVPPAARVVRTIGRILADTYQARASHLKPLSGEQINGWLDFDNFAEVLPGVPSTYYVKALMAWTQLYGFINFELFGHFRGSVIDSDLAFEQVTKELWIFLGFEATTES